MKREKSYQIYGLARYRETVDDIIQNFGERCDSFALRMLLTEAFSNAFIHGNNRDPSSPINVHCQRRHHRVTLNIQHVDLRQSLDDEGPADDGALHEHGRGLLLLKHYAHQVILHQDSIKITTEICREEG